MNFANYLKRIKLKHIGETYVPIESMRCQYNPDRFKYWDHVCGNSMTIQSSPFWEYLNYKKQDKYYDLFRLYGRTDEWIKNNILKFQVIYESIASKGYKKNKDLPVVLLRPIVENEYNNNFEIYEGHRRLTICLYLRLNQKVLLCEVV